MSNEITIKSYLFLLLIFPFMIVLAIANFLISNMLLFFLFVAITLVLGILLILLKPEKTIKIKYGEKILINIG
jgi:hypothetical protein